MPQSLVLSFKKNISLSEESSDNFVLKSPNFNFNLQQISPGLLAAIKILCADGATEEDLSEIVLQTDSFSELPKFYYYLEQLIDLGMICHSVYADGFPIATMVPISTPDNLQFSDVALDKKYVLSRFAYCHKDNLQMVLESPLSTAQIILTDWRGGAIATSLASPQDCCTLAKIPGVSESTAQMFLSLLLSAKMLCLVEENGRIQEEESETFAQWEFHDLLFHSRSRTGRNPNLCGKTYRFLGKIQPLPAIEPKVSCDIIELYQPDIEKLKEIDYPFTSVLENRKSIRINGDKPITDKQLGEFLYRSARVRKIVPRDNIECSDRPYPSGGASYELELYLVVNTCENIPSGLYYYYPLEHQLCKVSGTNSYVESLLKDAEQATGQQCNPQVLIIFAARFQRVSWAYESIAYSLILKHVGVLYQTMYLVATAMELAPCAIGAGNPDLFAAATGCDYYAESSVGEFILGS